MGRGGSHKAFLVGYEQIPLSSPPLNRNFFIDSRREKKVRPETERKQRDLLGI